MKARPRRVDFLNQSTDLQVLILGRLGFSTDFIMRRTGLSAGQVMYRLGKGHTRRLDYRDGKSREAETVLDAVQKSVAHGIKTELNGEKGQHDA